MMHPVRKRRLISVILLMLGISIAVLLASYALRQNISLYYTPTQISKGEAPVDHAFRIGGMVKKASVKHPQNDIRVEFVITDFSNDVTVHYDRLLPDLFREGQGIVAEGRLDANQVFIASEVLAKHDENYMPPAAKQALNNKTKS